MVIECPNCFKRYSLDKSLLSTKRKQVRCTACRHIWIQSLPHDTSHVFLETHPKAISKNRTREIRWVLLLTGFPLALLGLFSIEKVANKQKIESVSFSFNLPQPKTVDVDVSFFPPHRLEEVPHVTLKEKDLWQEVSPLRYFTSTPSKLPRYEKAKSMEREESHQIEE